MLDKYISQNAFKHKSSIVPESKPNTDWKLTFQLLYYSIHLCIGRILFEKLKHESKSILKLKNSIYWRHNAMNSIIGSFFSSCFYISVWKKLELVTKIDIEQQKWEIKLPSIEKWIIIPDEQLSICSTLMNLHKNNIRYLHGTHES